MRHPIARCLVCLVIIGWFLPAAAQNKGTINVAFSEFPPYKIAEKKDVSGIDIEILEEIATRMDRSLTFKRGTFEDCLKLMEQGQADVMSSLLRRPEREAFIHYVQPRYRVRSVKVFYVLQDNHNALRSYGDLQKLKIGVKTKASYAPMFDNDERLNKIPSDSIKINISKLVAGKIDTFITTDLEGDYWVQKLNLENRIVKAPYKFMHSDSIYMGISKKSAFVDEAGEFGHILKELVDTGEVQKIIDRYRKP